MNEHLVALTSENWEQEVLKSELPVLVDFWAEWCPPCRLIGPVVDALAEDFKGRARVGKLDVDASPEVAGRFGVCSIPTLLVFKNGLVVDQRVGAASREALQEFLGAHAAVAEVAAASVR